MKKDCTYTRKSLQKYLRGHLFKYEQIRIARHLNVCPICRSEFQALKKVADTKRLLKDITPPEGVVQQLKAGAGALRRLKLLIYRPLWLLLIAAVATLVYINVFAPQRDIEIENIEKSLPPAAPVASALTATSSAEQQAAPVQQTAAQKPAPKPLEAVPAPEPLLITITPTDEDAVRRINEVMHGHAQLKKLRFSDSVREVSGSLMTDELLTFFSRIDQAGNIRYSRKRLQSFPAAQPVAFTIKMKPVPKPESAVSPAPAPPPTAEAEVSAPTKSVP